MQKIKVNHYTDLKMFQVEQVVKNLKFKLNQFITNLDINITPEQLLVLDTIYSHDNICQQDVALLLSKDKSNIKRIVEILENNKLITRTAGRKNNRLVNYLSITEEGKKILDNNINEIKGYMEELFKDISDEEVKALDSIIKKLNS